MSNLADMIAGGPPAMRKSWVSTAIPISILSGTVVAVNRPPGRARGNGTMPNGFDGSGLLGLIAATSNVVSDDPAADGATGACADAVVARSSAARANGYDERNMISLLYVLRTRLSDQGASTLTISGSSTGDLIQAAFVVGIPASCTPAARITVTHATPNAAENTMTPTACRGVSSRSARSVQKRKTVASTLAAAMTQLVTSCAA